MTETDSTRSERVDAAVFAMIGALRALRTAPPVERPAFELRAGTVAQWQDHFDNGAEAPTVSFAASVAPAAEGADVGELIVALEQVEADNAALARVHHWWIQHRRHLGTSLGDAEAVFTRQLEIVRYVIDYHDPITEAAS
ncbi:hypothetical protein [Rhodococcus sp. NPDC060176]|uniref:hypothetical protein n=1 Tax=Rhodococcus sp. NPDC060176 TaxID=3347062 RepID=UPI0036486B7C